VAWVNILPLIIDKLVQLGRRKDSPRFQTPGSLNLYVPPLSQDVNRPHIKTRSFRTLYILQASLKKNTLQDSNLLYQGIHH
jgi:hypothetical protein